VLSLEKDSATIGERIGQFFAEYVPQHQLMLDATRPSYEVYYTQTMDYCIPIEEVDGLQVVEQPNAADRTARK
jgi:hypothetical protein